MFVSQRLASILGMLLATASLGFAQAGGGANPADDAVVTLLAANENPAAASAAAEPAPVPTPAPAPQAVDPHVMPGTDFPHQELFLGYSYINVSPGNNLPDADFNGGSASFAYNFTRYLGLVGDFGGYHTGDYGGVPDVSSNIISYLFGPRVSFRNSSRVTPFIQFLLGGARLSSDAGSLGGPTSLTSNGFALATGGGLDFGLTRRVALRLPQVEYFMTRFDSNLAGAPSHQNNLRASAGLLLRWGYNPVAVNQTPMAACSVNPNTVVIGSDTAVALNVSGSDADGDALSYAYSASGGNISGTGATARWDLANQNPGSYTATAQVSDGHGGATSCTASVTVDPRPNRPPTVTVTGDRPTVLVGERVGFTAVCTDPDGDPLRYTWSANSGQIVGTGASVQLDSTGLAPGTYTATARCEDGRGGAADASASVQVQAPPPPPMASKIGQCDFGPVNSARVDNVCKRVLDDVVVRLQNDPQATVVIVGFADPGERQPATLAETRATNMVNYLATDRGVNRARTSTRTGTGQTGAGATNRRGDIIWVPAGATY
jgi:outer membrane protein OmpA-like peptidoglycan-associated protein